MTFEDFQALCNGVATSGTPASSACPIYIGDEAAKTIGWYGQGFRQLVILKEQVPHESMLSILNSCRFTYDAANSLTVINPITTVNA
jgi:hypothetical protein